MYWENNVFNYWESFIIEKKKYILYSLNEEKLYSTWKDKLSALVACVCLDRFTSWEANS